MLVSAIADWPPKRRVFLIVAVLVVVALVAVTLFLGISALAADPMAGT